MSWEIEYTDQFGAWWDTLSAVEQERVGDGVTILAAEGPTLGRPLVDTLRGSRHANMKELRPAATNIRVLFAFDPRRTAIMLIGGDKTNRWQEWYAAMLPIADDLYDQYLDELRKEGLI